MGGALLRPLLACTGPLKAAFKTCVHYVVKNIFVVFSNYSYNSPGNIAP
jgi:hypothetical protein